MGASRRFPAEHEVDYRQRRSEAEKNNVVKKVVYCDIALSVPMRFRRSA